MRVIARMTVADFWRLHPIAEQSLRAWYHCVRAAHWRGPAEVRAHFASASFLPGNRIVFNIKGNDYRLVVAARYDFETVYIRFVGTHADYDKVDATTV